MNRNLKRVLSLALTLIVMAVNFVIPAMASEPITISYEVLKDYDRTTTGSGTVYLDKDTANVGGQYHTDYSPLEVWKVTNQYPNRDSLNMLKGEWVRLEANVPVGAAGYYEVDVLYGRATGAAADVVIRTDSYMIDADLPSTGNQYTFANASVKLGAPVGYLYLNEGLNYIYVDNRSQTINFKELYLTPVNTVDATDVTILSYVTDAPELAEITPTVSYTGTDGYKVIDIDNTTVTFAITVAENGKYALALRGKAGEANTVTATFAAENGSEIVHTVTVDNTTWADASLGVFTLEAGDYTVTLSGLADYKMAWATLAYVAPYLTIVDTTSVDEGTAKRGTDNIVVTFTDTMDPEASNEVTLEAEDGTKIATKVDVEDTVATISLLETLAYNTEYTLTLNGFKSVNDADALDEWTGTFITCVEGDDAGTETSEAPEVIADVDDENKFTIQGVVKGSTGYPIAGRKVFLIDPDGVTVVADTTSGENGIYEFAFDMEVLQSAIVAEGNSDILEYKVKAEYGEMKPAQIRYLPQAAKDSIMQAFDSATTAADIDAIFAVNADILGVASYATDCTTGLTDADLFRNHFIDAEELNTVYDIPAFYQKALTIEKLNQSTNPTYVRSNLTAAKCEELGLYNAEECPNLTVAFSVETTGDEEKFNEFVAKDTFNKSPSNPNDSTNPETFAQRLERLAGEWLLNRNDIKNAPDLVAPNGGSAYSADEADVISIPVTYFVKQSKVKRIEVTLESTIKGLVSTVTFEKANDFVASVSPRQLNTQNAADATQVTFIITMGDNGEEKEYTAIGNLKVTAPEVSSGNSSEYYPMTLKATTFYGITAGTAETEIEWAAQDVATGMTVSDYNPGSGSSSSSSSSSFSGPAPLQKPVDAEDTNKSQYFFDDMSEALWAQDMVHALVGKGVISKNDQRAFRPMDNISREEVVKMLVTVVGSHDATQKSTLADVSGDHWATSYIATAQQLGIVQGNADGTFGLGQQITRQDMAVMIYRTFKLLGIDLATGNTQFTDAANIAGYAQDAISALQQQGIINGMGDGSFAPVANATRAQAAKVIYVMMEVLGV